MAASVAPLPPNARPLHAEDAPTPLREPPQPRPQPRPQWVGQSARLHAVITRLRQFSPSPASVLITGETGTGKELAAAEIHTSSGRTGPFVATNCGALSKELVNSHLFGHARGAFTGAVAARRGSFAQAHGGTLFLDEVGELPLACQAVLLRVLETGRVRPVGAETERSVQTRVVCATHRDLEAMVARGTFRADLFHRLSVLSVHMPALRERPEDIDPLLDHFALAQFRVTGTRVQFTHAARDLARGARWAGNVRELRNAVHRASLLTADGCIDADDLLPPGSSQPASRVTLDLGSFEAMRREMLREVVERLGSQRKAAAVLGIPRSTLGNWLREV